MTILETVSNFYQRNLSNEKALEYLQSQGITSKEALDAFKVGYANSGLTKNLPSNEVDEIIKVGLADNNGRNRFKSSLIFPLTDTEGNITDLCGQNLGANGTIKCISDKAKGCGNLSVLKATKEIIITDYPLEALKLYQLGHRNVILTPDIHAASLIHADKVTVLSYRHADNLAKHVYAPEVWHGSIRPIDKSPEESLKRIKCLKEPMVKVAPKCSNILDKVVSDLDKLGYIGEPINKKLAYLISISRKLSRPLSAIIISSSGAGKTGLMRAIADLVPDEDKMLLSRLTPQALYHMPKDALMEKLIVVDERNGSSMADYSIRTMQTSNVLTLARPKSKNNEDGIKSINVRCAYMESTTSDNINPENASRCFVLHLDESPTATEAVLRAQRMARNGNGKANKQDVLIWHHDHQRALKSLPVTIPFAHLLTFPTHRVSYRREQEKFLSLIEASALLHQADRTITNGVIQASVEDYRIAHDLFLSVFKDMSREVSRNALALLKLFEKENIVSFTMREALTLTGWSYTSLYRVIQELKRYEYIRADHDKRGGQKKTFTRLDYHRYGKTIHQLMPPDELSAIFSDTVQRLSSNCSDQFSSKSKTLEPTIQI